MCPEPSESLTNGLSESDSAELNTFHDSRAAFVGTWIENNRNLTTESANFLRELVFSEEGPWNDSDSVIEVFEERLPNRAVVIVYDNDGQHLEVPFEY